MPAIFYAILFAASVLCAATTPAFAAERRFTVTDFDRIQVEGPFTIVLEIGKAPSALATGGNAVLDRVKLDVEGRTLRVRPDRSSAGSYSGAGTNAATVRIVLSTHGLRSASVAGSSVLTIDKAKAMRFDLAVDGSGKIALGRVEADTLNIGLMGAGKIEIGGMTKILRATIKGSGDLDARSLVAQDARINADTSGRIDANARDSAIIIATGSGDTVVKGKPACTIRQTGAGQVICGNK